MNRTRCERTCAVTWLYRVPFKVGHPLISFGQTRETEGECYGLVYIEQQINIFINSF